MANLSESMGTRRQWNNTFKLLKEKKKLCIIRNDKGYSSD